MYNSYLGDTVPLILQGGGAYNTPATPKVSPLMLYGAVGLLAAYLILGTSAGRKLW